MYIFIFILYCEVNTHNCIGPAGPTVLEVFNTLLRQLRLSVDYELTGSYDGSTNIGTKIIKAHEERQLQEAVIRTIGQWVGSCDFFKYTEKEWQ